MSLSLSLFIYSSDLGRDRRGRNDFLGVKKPWRKTEEQRVANELKVATTIEYYIFFYYFERKCFKLLIRAY